MEAYPNTLRSEHLNPQTRPIIACFTDLESLKGKLQKLKLRPEGAIIRTGVRIDNSSHTTDHIKEKITHVTDKEDRHFSVVSQIDSQDKFSTDYFNCTGLIAVGRDKETGREISFLSHQDPKEFLRDQGNRLRLKLEDCLQQFKNRCEVGTIDVVVVGGQSFEDVEDDSVKLEYVESIMFLDRLVMESLDFHPVVFQPKQLKNDLPTHVMFDTANRRLYIFQESNENIKSLAFSSDELTEDSEQ